MTTVKQATAPEESNRADARLLLGGKALGFLFVLALGLRLTAWVADTGGTVPPSDLWDRAQNVLRGHGPVGWVRGVHEADPRVYDVIWQFSPVYRRPLPWMTFVPFAALPEVFQGLVCIFTAGLGALTVVFVAWLASDAGGARAGWTAGIIAATFPYQVFNNYQPYDTVFVSVGMAVLLWCLYRWHTRVEFGYLLGAGGAAAWLLLSRFSTPVFVGLMGLWLLSTTPGNWWRRARVGAAFAAVAIIPCIPWMIFVHAYTGHWSMGPGVGKGLYWAYNPHTMHYYPWDTIDLGAAKAWNDLPLEYREAVATGVLRDFEANELPRAHALRFITENPWTVACKLPEKLLSPWLPFSPWQQYGRPQWEKRLVHGTTSYCTLVIAVVGFAWLWRVRKTAFWLLLLPWVSMFFTATLMWTHSRGRAEFDPLLFVVAGVGLALLVQPFNSRAARAGLQLSLGGSARAGM